MKQILQSLRDGTTTVAEIPAPRAGHGQLLIRTTTSLVSAGTERMMVEFGKAGWIDKARQQPDKVRMVLYKARTDGVAATLDAVRDKLDQPLAPGYSNVGVVVDVGPGTSGFRIGDRVASNGRHAEFVCVPTLLCARIPDGVSDDAAAFTVLGAIGMQGVRLANPTLGECVAVVGLGLIGLLTVQILRAQGCRVFGVDLDPRRLELGRRLGAEVALAGADALSAALAYSRGRGVDAVLITAATASNEPVRLAARMSRKRGRIVLVGVTGLELSRADFYEKELSFQVSCSYGPGRYDPAYESGGNDYPIGFVRWTEQRNFEAFLDLLAARAIDVLPLISRRCAIVDAGAAYDCLESDTSVLGILLDYDRPTVEEATPRLPPRTIAIGEERRVATAAAVGFIGAGNYAGRVLIPAFKAAGARLQVIASSGGVSAAHHGRKFGFATATTDVDTAIDDPACDTVVIATRHDTHAALALRALAAGKHVFVEKPLCLSLDELERFERGARTSLLMVGFNRRFAPHTRRIRELLQPVSVPKALVMTVNAGAAPAGHWTEDPAIGGGRLIGEACHFIDLLRHLADCPITGFDAIPMRGGDTTSSATITLSFVDGSIGTIHYLANGSPSFPKERLEVFCAGRVLRLDNFRKLDGWGYPQRVGSRLWRQDKGQNACAAAFVAAVRNGGPPPIPADELFEVARVTIGVAALAADQARTS